MIKKNLPGETNFLGCGKKFAKKLNKYSKYDCDGFPLMIPPSANLKYSDEELPKW